MLSSSHTHPERGSALFVTIMITSVALLFAMILLERIIPYSKQIRGMQNSLQAYYTARSEVEMARYTFLQAPARANQGDTSRITETGNSLTVWLPTFGDDVTGKYVVVSNHTALPLQIKLFESDASPQGFGTSQKDSAFHTLPSYGWGMLLDFSGQDTVDLGMTMNAEDTSSGGNVDIEFVHSSNDTTSFFGTIEVSDEVVMAWWGLAAHAGIVPLADILGNDCANASCAMKLRLSDSSATNLPVSFTFSKPIPDLNAVIIADGLSSSADYHTRIVELIPLTQSI